MSGNQAVTKAWLFNRALCFHTWMVVLFEYLYGQKCPFSIYISKLHLCSEVNERIK